MFMSIYIHINSFLQLEFDKKMKMTPLQINTWVLTYMLTIFYIIFNDIFILCLGPTIYLHNDKTVDYMFSAC